MQDKFKYEVDLNKHQMSFLEEMSKKFGLEDSSKALRCLINFAIDESAEHDRIFDEVRCLDCG
jgi:hypothetical protein